MQILHPFGPDKLSDSMEIIPGVSRARRRFDTAMKCNTARCHVASLGAVLVHIDALVSAC